MCAALSTFDRVGPFNEEFFLYGEDVDYCLRARRLGIDLEVCVEATIAHQAALMALGLKLRDYPFSHGAVHALPVNPAPGGFASGTSGAGRLTLYDSYHCSRYNTQTRRLTTDMFEQVFVKIDADLVSDSATQQQRD